MPIVEERDGLAVICLVDAGDASARKQTAGQAAENPHRGFLDSDPPAMV
jgi:hypothetical protein